MTSTLTRAARGASRRASGLVHVFARVRQLEAEVAELRSDIDELRRDGRRVAELYDLVVEELSRRPEANGASEG